MTESRGCTSAVESIVACVQANRANSLPLLACLHACETNAQPYRDVERALAGEPIMRMSTQNVHVLMDMLIEAGGIEATAFDEGEDGERSADQPAECRVKTTEAGCAAMARLEPVSRFAELLVGEPHGYEDAYKRVLSACVHGASRAEVEATLAGHPALTNPKVVYPSYFISKLETIGGLSWDGIWRTTESGSRMSGALAETFHQR